MQWEHQNYNNQSNFLKPNQSIENFTFSQSPRETPKSQFKPQHNLQPKLSQKSHSSPQKNSPKQKLYTIACIDDNKSVLMAINAFLDDPKFSVIMINNPVRALMQITRSKPDLILLDVTMPNLDGYELCSLLRRHPFFKTIPIIMVTGNTGFIDRAKAKLVKATDYLTKPFTKTDLLQMLEKHLP